MVNRIKNICFTPKSEWLVIAAEARSAIRLMTGYVVPLAGIGSLVYFVRWSVIGFQDATGGISRQPIVSCILQAVFAIVIPTVLGLFVMSRVINALAPDFGGEKNSAQALKLAVYSYTPALVVGWPPIWELPASSERFEGIGLLGLIAGLPALYSLYLLYVGLPRLLKCPADRALGYAASAVCCMAFITFAGLFTLMILLISAGAGG